MRPSWPSESCSSDDRDRSSAVDGTVRFVGWGVSERVAVDAATSAVLRFLHSVVAAASSFLSGTHVMIRTLANCTSKKLRFAVSLP